MNMHYIKRFPLLAVSVEVKNSGETLNIMQAHYATLEKWKKTAERLKRTMIERIKEESPAQWTR